LHPSTLADGSEHEIHIAFRYMIFGVALCAAAIADASPGRATPTNSLVNGLRAWMQRYDVPTASLAIMQDGNFVGSFGFGGWQPGFPPQRIAG
jgi:hypothetical protein